MAMAASTTDGEPMMDINTTPLIDVMLVLLIMFIITIPIQTHAVKLDLPVDDPSQKTPPPIDPVKNKVTIDPAGQVFWNGSPVSLTVLRQYLDQTQTMNPVPELHLQPDPQARYEVVDEVLAVTKRAQVEKMGFVGNEAYGSW
ncbi:MULTISPECIES: ExbD/TolR family protein [Sphingomonadales]|uniref:Biopolymer transporter ExbD n=2 Tax=Edaphosphingomonas TaxID=3423724 RepID=A0A2T4I5Q8_9SPHN|nr:MULTISPECIES: biopolymer transporter ExbD [Sphingomonas]AGH50775.1 biopolymer transport protein ExbD/TolR [Sphingomonas sp. MM-1]MDX3884844.1 biopolymer transporter ExbD [Sphingomonas sp.]OHT19189.1 Biopolymer transport protein ExbD [Sphingomonas haloaromaticamans]PTD25663.1 biopolymer transporter ExbD [Sphingomonas fennica]